RRQRNQTLPTLDLKFVVSQKGSDEEFSKSFNLDDFETTAFVSTSLPQDRGRTKALAKAFAIDLEILRIDAARRKGRIRREIVARAREIDRTWQNIDLKRKEVAFAEQKAGLAKLRYERGLDDNAVVLLAQSELLASKKGLTASVIEYRLAVLRYLISLGRNDLDELFPESRQDGKGCTYLLK
ncbi:TolC family protein, partial [Acidobacteriota bacterium]